MNMIDRELEVVKRIADALTPLGIDVMAIRSVRYSEYVRPESEALHKPRTDIGYGIAELTIRVPFAECPASPESSDRSQEHGSR
jgi:hypothetical protein